MPSINKKCHQNHFLGLVEITGGRLSVVVDFVVVVVVDFLQIAEFVVVVHIVDLFLLDFVSDSIDIYNLLSC